MKKRISQGYGKISPKNCYLDGLATNCHLNALITETIKSKKEILLWGNPPKNPLFPKVENSHIL
jgi:hypothetical protein